MRIKLFTTLTLLAALTCPAFAQEAPPAPEQPAAEPSLDDLLDLEGEDPKPADPKPTDEQAPVAPELTRELDRRLTGDEAAEQFAQAVQDMSEVASRLGEDADAGIDTQRLQEEIILKLEQIISSAEKSKSQQSSSSSQQQQQQQSRQADRGSQQQQQQQQGQKPGEQQGEQQGEQPGEQQGEKPGGQRAQDGQTPADGANRGSVRNGELSMNELREGEWGNLPPRLRDELAESLSETFNPVYRSATEAFYRRIAEMSQQEAEGE